MIDINQVSIDSCHADLVYGLVRSLKPTKILELGFGSGLVTRTIQKASLENHIPVEFTVVDNWFDWNFNYPESFIQSSILDSPVVSFITSSEHSFVAGCKTKFDFIFSDADHTNSHKWFEHVYLNLLNQGGIMICHDVLSNDFPNLKQNLEYCRNNKLRYVVLSNNSIASERCERGLLVIFKD